jgi:uncharacterized protein
MRNSFWMVRGVVVLTLIGGILVVGCGSETKSTTKAQVSAVDSLELKVAEESLKKPKQPEVKAKVIKNPKEALLVAGQVGDVETVKAMLAQGVDANLKAYEERTLLIVASINGYTDVVEALLAKGAQVNAKDQMGWTALKHAKKRGHTDIAEILTKSGGVE